MDKRCAIFNYWWAWGDAHGASLTALALYKLIEELGYKPCLIMTVFKGMDVEQCKRGRHFKFISQYAKYSEKNYQTGEDYEELNSQFQHFIVGSDQVLRLEWVPDEWFLYSISSSKNKIMMSGSFGGNRINASEQRINRVAEYLQDFSAVSVREKDGIEVYYRYFGKRDDLEWIMDPVFLIHPQFYKELINQNLRCDEFEQCAKESILFYILDYTPEIECLKKKISVQYNVNIIEDSEDLRAEDFLYLVDNCKMVITDSFHGMCFSIILNRPFYCVYNKMRGTSRVDTIRELLGLNSVVFDLESVPSCEFDIPQIDYNRINGILEKERERGKNWLKNNLQKNVREENEDEKVR